MAIRLVNHFYVVYIDTLKKTQVCLSTSREERSYLSQQCLILNVCHQLHQSLEKFSQALFKFGLTLIANRSKMQPRRIE